jgi:hypothetical protein
MSEQVKEQYTIHSQYSMFDANHFQQLSIMCLCWFLSCSVLWPTIPFICLYSIFPSACRVSRIWFFILEIESAGRRGINPAGDSTNYLSDREMVFSNPSFNLFQYPELPRCWVKGAQVWDFRSLWFSWYLQHKALLGRWLWGKNIN